MPSGINSFAGGGDRITRAIAQSAKRTGVDFDYLMGQARIESGMNPNAKAPTSSATGLYQFISQSWLAVVDQHGAQHGLDWASNAIQRDSRGRYNVADPATRRAILDLRKNPEAAAAMAGEFAADNRDYLEQRQGRQMAPVDLYLAHFLGAGGANKFLSAHACREPRRRGRALCSARPQARTATSSTPPTDARAASTKFETASPPSLAATPICRWAAVIQPGGNDHALCPARRLSASRQPAAGARQHRSQPQQ